MSCQTCSPLRRQVVGCCWGNLPGDWPRILLQELAALAGLCVCFVTGMRVWCHWPLKTAVWSKVAENWMKLMVPGNPVSNKLRIEDFTKFTCLDFRFFAGRTTLQRLHSCLGGWWTSHAVTRLKVGAVGFFVTLVLTGWICWINWVIVEFHGISWENESFCNFAVEVSGREMQAKNRCSSRNANKMAADYP